MSTAGVIGAAVGLAIAIAEFLFLRVLATRVELPETKKVLNITGICQLVLLPIIGWFVAPLLVASFE